MGLFFYGWVVLCVVSLCCVRYCVSVVCLCCVFVVCLLCVCCVFVLFCVLCVI